MFGLFTFLQDADNYEDRKVGNNEVNGLTVSTAYSSDEGYETALGDQEGFHPVQRYETKEEAIVGHYEWMEKAETIEQVLKLGWGDWVEPEMYTLIR